MSDCPTCRPRLCPQAVPGDPSQFGQPADDLLTYNLQGDIKFNGTPLTVVVDCPPGFICAPGSYPVTVTYPPGTFIIPDYLTVIDCSGNSITAATVEELIRRLANAQALCDTLASPPTGWVSYSSSRISLQKVGVSSGCLDSTFDFIVGATLVRDLFGQYPTVESWSVSGTASDNNTVATFFLHDDMGFRELVRLAGTFDTIGTFILTVTATLVGGESATIDITFNVAKISDAALAGGTVGAAYAQTLAIDGASTGSEVWSITSGTLPDGLSLNVSTGEITGTPTTEGTSSFICCFSNQL